MSTKAVLEQRTKIKKAIRDSQWSSHRIRPLGQRPPSRLDAMWQYVIDHAQATPKGIRAVLHFRNRSDFNYRIDGRMKGLYRKDEATLEKEIADYLAQIGEWKVGKALDDRLSYVINMIHEKGTLRQRAIVWVYRKSRDYLRDEKQYLAAQDAAKKKHEADTSVAPQEEREEESSKEKTNRPTRLDYQESRP